MRVLCVFCGASTGADPAFAEAARDLGREIAGSGRTLVYGGGKVGLMGALADAALSAGGSVVGVIPASLMGREVAHAGLTRLDVVTSMHERKARMAELSDGFVALPGGLGTLEELFEVWTWGQLGLHGKPYGLLDVAGFYSPLIHFLDRVVEQRFIRQEHRDMLLVDTDPRRLVERMSTYHPPAQPRVIGKEEA